MRGVRKILPRGRPFVYGRRGLGGERAVGEKLHRAAESRISYKAGRNPIESITSRVKKPVSIVGKLKRLGKPITIEAISEYLNDVAGIRVICPFIDDIYKVAEMLAVQDDITVVQVKDYIRKPKPNGYRSYHMIVEIPVFFSEGKRMMRVEIQLRTVAMDFWASLEHQMKYKKESADRPEIAAELKSCAETIAATDARMLGIRKRIESLEKQTEDEKEDAMPAGVRQFW